MMKVIPQLVYLWS